MGVNTSKKKNNQQSINPECKRKCQLQMCHRRPRKRVSSGSRSRSRRAAERTSTTVPLPQPHPRKTSTGCRHRRPVPLVGERGSARNCCNAVESAPAGTRQELSTSTEDLSDSDSDSSFISKHDDVYDLHSFATESEDEPESATR